MDQTIVKKLGRELPNHFLMFYILESYRSMNKYRMKLTGLVFGTLTLVSAAVSQAAVVVEDNFESYTTTAEMQVNWGNTGLGALNTAAGNPGKSAQHPGGVVNRWIGSAFSLVPTGTESIVLTADIFDDGTSANERITVGLRNGTNPLFEMGHYNSTTEQYHVRVLNMYGGENWTPLSTGLKTSSGQPAGWNRYQATFTATDLTVTLDLGADGSIDGTFVSVGAPSANPFVDLRFGGPSNLSSAGGGVSYDNIKLSTVAVPEPGLTSMFALLGLGIFVRRRS